MNTLLVFWLMALNSWLLYSFKKTRLAKLSLIVGLAWLFCISVSPLPVWLLANLEAKNPTFKRITFEPTKSIHILVLGGGHHLDSLKPTPTQLSDVARSRLMEALRIKQFYPDAKLICSGYGGTGNVPHAQILASSAEALGVNPENLIVLPDPKNTKEEIETYASKFGSDANLILVTSASHMPRAMLHCRNVGLAPYVAPAHFYVESTKRIFLDFKPSFHKIQFAEIAFHEYVGRWVAGF